MEAWRARIWRSAITANDRVMAWPQRAFLRVWSSPVGSGLSALVVYTLLAAVFDPRHLAQSIAPYFLYLADAFLHGQLALRVVPPNIADLVFYHSQIYLYWPPFPAVLLMPLVAILGLNFSDTPINLLIGAVNVALVSLLLREMQARKVVDLPADKRAWLTAFFAFGTVHITLAARASVWFTAQVIAFALVAATYLVALHFPGWRGALAAGFLAGCAFLTRNPEVFAVIWAAWYILSREWKTNRKGLPAVVLAGALPALAALGLFMLYNYARFGSVTNVGLDYHNMADYFRADYARYGAFNLHYLPTNLYYYFVAFPYAALLGDNPGLFWMGGSVFLMSPIFLFAIRGVARSWRSHGSMLAISCIAGLTPALLLMGTGWVQFGPRYTLDVTVPLLIATALGLQTVSTGLISRLSIYSIFVYVPGTILLSRLS